MLITKIGTAAGLLAACALAACETDLPPTDGLELHASTPPNLNVAPWTGVVAMKVPGKKKCMGTRVGARRLLTSAACARDHGIVLNKTLRVTNRVDGTFPEGAIWTVVSVYDHPTYSNVSGAPGLSDLAPAYDLAVVELNADLPSIIAIVPVSDGEAGPAPAAELATYGCNGGKQLIGKQLATLDEYQQGTGLSADIAYRDYVYHVAATAGLGGFCAEQRGAPIFRLSSGAWVLAGVLTRVAPGGNFYLGARTGNAAGWIQTPRYGGPVSDFVDGAHGALLNVQKNMCAGVAGSTAPHAEATQGYCGWRDATSDTSWTLVQVGDRFQLKNGQSGLCLSAPESPEVPVVQETCADDPAQRWEPNFRASGYLLHNEKSGYCLQVVEYEWGLGLPLTTEMCVLAAEYNEQWWFVP